MIELARVTRDLGPGVPDRLLHVADSLEHRRPDIQRIELVDDPRQLRWLWRSTLRRLEELGVEIGRRDAGEPSASSETDLGRAQRSLEREAQGDGSLLLLRPYGPLAAAEEVAAWIADNTDVDSASLVVIGAEPVLDRALHRFGLPTTGAGSSSGSGTLSQLLPLVLELGWAPADPDLALELLALPARPIPGSLARRLARALHEWPGVGSPEWERAMEEGLAALDLSAEERTRVEERTRRLFDARVPRAESYPRTEIEQRLAILESWLRARTAMAARDGADEALAPHLATALGQATTLHEVLARAQMPALTMAQLHRIARSALQAAGPLPSLPHETGVHVVGKPGALAGSADRVVWWSFNLAAVERRTRLPLTASERDELASVGVELPDLAEQALFEAARWRRALAGTRKKLLLVCPTTADNGDEIYPHPLWDQISSFILKPERLQTVHAQVSARATRRRPPWRALPSPRRRWTTAPDLLGLREAESPSSLGSLLGCSLRWALHYKGDVRAGLSAPFASGPLLQGRLAHEIVGRVLRAAPSTPDAAREVAASLFDQLGVSLAAPLFLPGSKAALDEARSVCTRAAAQIVEYLQESGLEILAVEESIESELPPLTIRARADLVVGRPLAIVDFKWRSASYWRRQLKAGTAYQMALYACLHPDDASGEPAEIAYFILVNGSLLTSGDAAFKRAQRIIAPSPNLTVHALQATHAERRRQLVLGHLEASGVRETEEDTVVQENALAAEGRLSLTPPCRFCDLGAMCGKWFEDT